mmetsp:Transcript_12180/g.33014  ORF Transcript_12180/g.33014 Transcript_12180/m.33014 type:complete len:317 (-) Transcript_12180:160-1110(-)
MTAKPAQASGAGRSPKSATPERITSRLCTTPAREKMKADVRWIRRKSRPILRSTKTEHDRMLSPTARQPVAKAPNAPGSDTAARSKHTAAVSGLVSDMISILLTCAALEPARAFTKARSSVGISGLLAGRGSSPTPVAAGTFGQSPRPATSASTPGLPGVPSRWPAAGYIASKKGVSASRSRPVESPRRSLARTSLRLSSLSMSVTPLRRTFCEKANLNPCMASASTAVVKPRCEMVPTSLSVQALSSPPPTTRRITTWIFQVSRSNPNSHAESRVDAGPHAWIMVRRDTGNNFRDVLDNPTSSPIIKPMGINPLE